MKKRNVIITLNELPLRSRKLSPEDVESVFGGCVHNGDPCKAACDCCGDSPICILDTYHWRQECLHGSL
jgi:hypothetical protein